MLRFFLFVLFLPAIVSAGEATARLDDFFTNVRTIRADFTQEVFDSRDNKIQGSSGKMLLSRPGRFRWDYTSPYKQLIVSDGRNVWLYDTDLEQVTIKSVDAVLGSTPALLLSGNTPLAENFKIHEHATRDGRYLVELKPIKNDTGFDSMLLGFGEKELEYMELHDSLGNTTRLVFTNAERNIEIDETQFTFTPPKGVDVIGEVSGSSS